jgi:hypothetical protein
VSVERDSQIFDGDKVTSWNTTAGQSWQFKKGIGAQLSATNTYASPAYPLDKKPTPWTGLFSAIR